MNIRLLFILFITAAMAGCVTQKKYDSLLAEKVSLESDQIALASRLAISQDSMAKLETVLKEAQATVAHLKKQLLNADNKYDSLQQQYKTLSEYYDRVTNNSGKLNKDLAIKQRQLLKMETNLAQQLQTNNELAANLAEREAKVKELEKILADKEAAVNALKQKVSNALLSFEENDLSVEVKNGKVYVSLAEQLLFNSGSTTVDAKGISAIKKLAQVLKNNPDVSIVVEGHTDNVPINSGNKYLNDNWDLSVLRATSIVKILVNNGADPRNVTAAGKGEFAPKESNETSRGKQTNRRTEIILTPKLDELFQLLEGN